MVREGREGMEGGEEGRIEGRVWKDRVGEGMEGEGSKW